MPVMGVHCQAIIESRHPDVLEMDAASHYSVEDVRQINDAIRYAPMSARYKVYILDEVHMLSGAAFNALLKTLEEPAGRSLIILLTDQPDALLATIRSRSQRRMTARQEKSRSRSTGSGTVGDAEKGFSVVINRLHEILRGFFYEQRVDLP